MCGFCGMLQLGQEPAAAALLEPMLATLFHRGPDDGGVFCDGPIGLANRRLAILDLRPEAALPMTRGPLTIAYNGEFYGFEAARAELLGKGHTFTTSGDTEVILALYREYGEAFVDHLRGMYAFALWDGERRRLLMGRDPAGKKPLFVHEGAQQMVFGSEIKCLLAHPAVPREARPEFLPLVLAYGYAPRPETCFRDIRCLEPGRLYIAADGQPLREARTFGPVLQATDTGPGDPAEWSERLLDAMRRAVGLRMISDVPLGAFLSGGVDSSLIVALMQEQASGPVRTFSMGFAGDPTWDETAHAEAVANHLGTAHTSFRVEPPDLPALLPELIWHVDQPFGDSSVVPTLMLSRLAREHVTVALSGDGGDELFAGYRRFEAARMAHAWRAVRPLFALASGLLRWLPQGTNYANKGREAFEFCDGAARPLPDAYFRWVRVASDEVLRRLAPRHHGADPTALFRSYFTAGDPRSWVSRLLDVNYHTYLVDDLLVKSDRMTMAASLELRSPFLDPEVVALASAMPTAVKLRDGVTKAVLKDAARPWLPDGIAERRKHGFGVPVGEWFRTSLRDYGRELLLSERSRQRELFAPAGLEALWSEHLAGRRDHGHVLWTLCSIEQWYRLFIDPAHLEKP